MKLKLLCHKKGLKALRSQPFSYQREIICYKLESMIFSSTLPIASCSAFNLLIFLP
jgi:hypothetical protein